MANNPIWNKIKQSFYRFMAGRYGHDQLNLTIIFIALILSLISSFTKAGWLNLISLGLLIYINVRCLSRNYVKRSAENRAFLNATKAPRRWIKAMRMNHSDKQHAYLLCPSCRQICRIPKGRGKVDIHCPGCGHTFSAKS